MSEETELKSTPANRQPVREQGKDSEQNERQESPPTMWRT
jgi:hypothetical protein